jgi:hypothetical protein
MLKEPLFSPAQPQYAKMHLSPSGVLDIREAHFAGRLIHCTID